MFALSLSMVRSSVVSGQSRPNAQTKFKNIKVLTELSDAQITREMQAWTKALGEKCTYCHEGNDYVTDANPKKEIARKMVQMVVDINQKYLDGKATCVLCHRGSATPDPNQVAAFKGPQ
jgi:photosynthetic reaction center cytochrome c subunit